MAGKEEKPQTIKDYQLHEKDTGSAEVQVALLTGRIQKLTAHLQANAKDHSSRRGLLKLVGRRRRRLVYVNRKDVKGYRKLISRLGLRK